ncbi:hypothetical protein [Micromonospora sp. NPDC005806]|uniref:hypothetical protein n=1 Tax=Micromonospora sp. NPDC005806 TaxID=3364234 RepID=UPI0036BBBEE6
MRRMRVAALPVAVSALILSTTGCATTETAAPPAAPVKAAPVEAAEHVLLGDGRDRTASQTASDWATYADHVLVVTILDEVKLKPSKGELARGEGMIGRTVKLRVDKVLWSAPDAPHAAPTTFNLSAAGWIFNNNDARTGEVKFALRDSSRLDKGHTYIKAIEWMDDPCSSDPKKGTWEGLGSGDTIPFDQGVLGAGEFEGKPQTLAEAKTKWQADGAPGVRLRAAGASVDKLVSDVKAAPVRAETSYKPECDPSDS